MSEPDPDYDDPRHSPERLLFLADGIFAISMTLLALDVRIPEGVANTAGAYADHSGELYKRLAVFVAAFWITSRFWVTNHRQMRLLHHVDSGVIERMMLFLAGICSLPVATSVLFRFGNVPAAVTFAALVLATTALLSARLWWYLSSPSRDLAVVPPHDRRRVTTRMILVAFVYLLAIPAAWLLQLADHDDQHYAGYAALVWLLMAEVERLADRVSDRMERRRPAAEQQAK